MRVYTVRDILSHVGNIKQWNPSKVDTLPNRGVRDSKWCLYTEVCFIIDIIHGTNCCYHTRSRAHSVLSIGHIEVRGRL